MQQKLNAIAEKFDIKGKITGVKPLGDGFINDTYIIETEADSPNYILQRKNRNIFTNIPAMMDNIQRVTTHLKNKIATAGGDPMREAMTITTTRDGKLCHRDEAGEYWAACLFIDDTIAHDAANTPELAYQGGRGIGKFQAMLSDFHETLTDILPGFHNMRYRFEQWDKVLAADPADRRAACIEQIEWIESRRSEMVDFWAKYEKGILPRRVTHNDTKINNILFDSRGEVLCVIDLDTVLNSTCLNDYGDAIRSYTNTGAEDDANLDNVSMDIDIFRAYTEGYMSQAKSFMTKSEVGNLAFAARYITFEQVLRFLMDYIDGDNYYKIKYADHNLVRAKAQYKLLQSMEMQFDEMQKIVTKTT